MVWVGPAHPHHVDLAFGVMANEPGRTGSPTDDLNAQYGCPDCGVHYNCSVIVAERDQLRAACTAANDAADAAANAVGNMAEKLTSLLTENKRLRGEADGWRKENDRHRALYVAAVKERDDLRLLVTRACNLVQGKLDACFCDDIHGPTPLQNCEACQRLVPVLKLLTGTETADG